VVLVVFAVAHRRLGPSSSASTSTTDRALPSSAVQARCWSRPVTTTRLPLFSLFPDELEALAGRMEDARSEALATLARTQRGPAVVPLRKGAGQ
jgi:hypothetical protein